MINLASVVGDLRPFSENNINATFKALAKFGNNPMPFPVVVKDLPERELFNELFAFLVLNELGLPVPRAFLGLLPRTEAQLTKAPTVQNGQRVAFLTEEVPSPNLKLAAGLNGSPSNQTIHKCLARIMPFLAQWELLGELYAFDGWVANVDRNMGNILFAGGSAGGNVKIWLIDHGRAFTSEEWQSGDLIPDNSYTNLLKHWASPYLSAEQKKNGLSSALMFQQKAQQLDREAKIDYLGNVFNLSDADKQAAKAFLQVRLGKIKEHSSDALMIGGMI